MSRTRCSLAAALLFVVALSCCGGRKLESSAGGSDGSTPANVEAVDALESARQTPQTPTEGADVPPPTSEADDHPDNSGDAGTSAPAAAGNLADNSVDAGPEGSNVEVKPRKLSNGDAARWYSSDARKKLPCAEWGTVVLTSTATVDGNAHLIGVEQAIKTANSGGFGLGLLQNSDGVFANRMCRDITKAVGDKVTAGGEYYYVNNGVGPAQATFVFWRAKGHPAKTPPAKLEAGLAAAAIECAAKGLPVEDLTDWPKCMGDQVIHPGALAAYVLIMTQYEASGVARDVPGGLGLVQKTVAVRGASLVIFALLL